MSEKTEINDNPHQQEKDQATQVNIEIEEQLKDLSNSLILNGKYKIIDKLPISSESGEADLFLVVKNDEKDQTKYIAKIYRRNEIFSPEKSKILKNLNSPYVAQIEDLGLYKKRQVIVLPFYKNGSLDGKIYKDLEKLKKIIFQINEGLKALHDQGIIHKDIKPANIMIKDNGDLAIIDFGISSVLASNATISKTKIGLTPQYSALETLIGGNFIKESDYYSFGILLYVLYIGHTPYQSNSEIENSTFQLLQHLPFPKDMPHELVNLIKGLTYNDLTNRHDLSNPNRRWIYQDVKNWLENKTLVVPGYALDQDTTEIEQIEGTTHFNQPYKFNNKEYHNTYDLVIALAHNWNLGQKHLFRGMLTSFCNNNSLSDLSIICTDAEEENRISKNNDLAFFKFLYKFDPNLTEFVWKDIICTNLTDLSNQYLKNLFYEQDRLGVLIEEILNQKLLSYYANVTAPYPMEELIKATLQDLEMHYQKGKGDQRSLLVVKFTLAYAFASYKYFSFHNQEFSNYHEITSYFYDLAQSSHEEYENEYHEFSSDPKNRIIFNTWLEAIS